MIRISPAQFKDLTDHLFDRDLDDPDTQFDIRYLKSFIEKESGENLGPGLYARITEYPEEGWFGPLGKNSTQSISK